MNKARQVIFILIGSVFLASCMPSPYYEKDYGIPQNAWDYKFTPSFKFEVHDTGVFYNIYFAIRHTEAYPYSNVWLKVHVKEPGDTVFRRSRIEVPLAAPSGQWLGRGMGELYEHRMMLTTEGDPSILSKPGVYEFKLEQDMRVNPLPEVLQVGLRVERGTAKPVSATKKN